MRTCLVVDDSQAIRAIARLILENLDFEIVEAEDGGTAIEHCRQIMPDAILLDLHAPVLSGIDFVRTLREVEDGDRPVVIVSAAERNSDDIAAAFEAGADEFVLKPFDRNSLESTFAQAGLI
jgi:two-component system chemotaxis response regulator CheY